VGTLPDVVGAVPGEEEEEAFDAVSGGVLDDD